MKRISKEQLVAGAGDPVDGRRRIRVGVGASAGRAQGPVRGPVPAGSSPARGRAPPTTAAAAAAATK